MAIRTMMLLHTTVVNLANLAQLFNLHRYSLVWSTINSLEVNSYLFTLMEFEYFCCSGMHGGHLI